jgi:hypothetical protein
VAELADAPDLGLRNHRYQNIAFRFNAKCFHEGKTAILAKSRGARMTSSKPAIAQILVQFSSARCYCATIRVSKNSAKRSKLKTGNKSRPTRHQKIKFEIGHVLFLDIVGYWKLLINNQSEQLQKLKEIVGGTEQVGAAGLPIGVGSW